MIDGSQGISLGQGKGISHSTDMAGKEANRAQVQRQEGSRAGVSQGSLCSPCLQREVNRALGEIRGNPGHRPEELAHRSFDFFGFLLRHRVCLGV